MKDPTRVAVTSRSFSRHPILRAELLARYENVSFNDNGQSLAGRDLINFLRGHAKAITSLERLDETIFSALPELRLVSKFGVGLDMVDVAAMERHGVLLGWTGGVNKRSVAELVIAFAISLLHRIPTANQEVRAGRWRQVVGRQLSSCTVGIIGCGHIGKEVAVLCRGFGCKVVAHDIIDFPEFYAEYEITPAGFEDLLLLSDVVSLHLPLDASTRNILNAERLALMKPDAVLINTARGNLVDEGALKARLMEGKLAGAAFDVFATEPAEDSELLNLPQFLATPHIGGSTEEAILAMGRAAIAGLETATLPGKALGSQGFVGSVSENRTEKK